MTSLLIHLRFEYEAQELNLNRPCKLTVKTTFEKIEVANV